MRACVLFASPNACDPHSQADVLAAHAATLPVPSGTAPPLTDKLIRKSYRAAENRRRFGLLMLKKNTFQMQIAADAVVAVAYVNRSPQFLIYLCCVCMF
jgi:hypothetical protein